MNHISVSKINLFEKCQYCFHLKYVIGLPQPEKDYFIVGKSVEAKLKELLEQNGKIPCQVYEEQVTVNQWNMAKAIHDNSEFQNLAKGKRTYQKEYKTEIDEIPFLAYTDIETKQNVIDIKTSASKWNAETVKQNKWQAIAYSLLSGKKFHFVIIKKSDKPSPHDVQIICPKISDEAIQSFKNMAKHVWNVWQNGLLLQQHSNKYNCLYPNITL